MCPIHCDYEDSSNMFGLSCNHLACKDCLEDFLKVNVEDGKVIQIKCIQTGCSCNFTAEDV